MMDDIARAHWLAKRAGKHTASRQADAQSYKKDGTPTQKRADYQRELLSERLSDATTRHYVTPAMEWGLEYEDEAKRAYEAHTGILVAEADFIEHRTIENFGCTPDGFAEHDGLVETKCPTSSTYVTWVLMGCVPEEHKPQMAAQCACTGRKWVDFVAYDPRIKEAAKRLFIRRYTPTAEEIEKVEAEAIKFLDELELLFDAFVTVPMESHEPNLSPARSDGPARARLHEQANS